MGSLLRYVWLFLANSNQSRSASIRAPNFYLICQFLLYLIVDICILELFVSGYLCPRGEDTAADFSRWGSVFPFLHKVVWGFVSGGVLVSFFRGLCFCHNAKFLFPWLTIVSPSLNSKCALIDPSSSLCTPD